MDAAHWALVAGMLVASCSRSDLVPAPAVHLPPAIDLGFADCGGAGPQAILDVTNDGGGTLLVTLRADAPFEIADPDASRSADGGLSLAIEAGTSSPVTIRGPSARASALPGAAITGTLHVVATAGGSFDVALSATIHGAALQLLPAQLDLGEIPVLTTSPPQTFTLTNSGNAAVSVHLGPPADPDFAVTLADATLGPGESAQGSATFFASSPGASQATAPLTVNGVVCAAPSAIIVSARGVEGAYGVSPGSLDFGQVTCGTAGQAQTVTLLDTGQAPFTFHASILGGRFTVSPSSGQTTASTTLTIQPLPVPSVVPTLNQSDKLVVVTDIPNDPPHVVPLQQSAYGALLSFFASSYSFGSSDLGTDKTLGGGVRNTGNAPVVVSAQSGSYSIATTTIQASGYGGTIVYHPDPLKLGVDDPATLTLDVVGPTCSPAASMQLDGRSHTWARSVVALDDATCAKANDSLGSIYCWGSNAKGQLGSPSSPGGALTPKLVPIQPPGYALSGGGAFVICQTSTSWAGWGTVNGSSFAPFARSGNVSWGAASDMVVCVAGATPGCMGQGGYLGDGTTNDASTFVPLNLSAWTLDTGFDGHTCAIGSAGGIACWGPDDWGQLGDGQWGASLRALSPVTASVANATVIAAGDGFTCAFQEYPENDVACWGRNDSAQCGAAPSSTPVLSPSIIAARAEMMAAGRDFTCLATPYVSCWGSNSVGQLGDAATEPFSAAPVPVTGLLPVTDLSAGGRHACVVVDNRIACWGENTYGQLGNGTTTDSATPVFAAGFD